MRTSDPTRRRLRWLLAAMMATTVLLGGSGTMLSTSGPAPEEALSSATASEHRLGRAVRRALRLVPRARRAGGRIIAPSPAVVLSSAGWPGRSHPLRGPPSVLAI
jgi:hypothetical protein